MCVCQLVEMAISGVVSVMSGDDGCCVVERRVWVSVLITQYVVFAS